MNAHRVITGFVSLLLSGAAVAAAPLGVPFGSSLGASLGRLLGGPPTVLGLQLGTFLPVAGGGLLTVATASLVAGILIVRRKKRR